MAQPAPAYGLDADGGERLRFSDAEFLIKASADTTGGAFTIIKEIAPLDTPLHVHPQRGRAVLRARGEHVFRCGEEEFHLGPRGVVFAPRGVPTPTGGWSPGRGAS